MTENGGAAGAAPKEAARKTAEGVTITFTCFVPINARNLQARNELQDRITECAETLTKRLGVHVKAVDEFVYRHRPEDWEQPTGA